MYVFVFMVTEVMFFLLCQSADLPWNAPPWLLPHFRERRCDVTEQRPITSARLHSTRRHVTLIVIFIAMNITADVWAAVLQYSCVKLWNVQLFYFIILLDVNCGRKHLFSFKAPPSKSTTANPMSETRVPKMTDRRRAFLNGCQSLVFSQKQCNFVHHLF